MMFFNILKRINVLRYRRKGVACDLTDSLSFRGFTVIMHKTKGNIQGG